MSKRTSALFATMLLTAVVLTTAHARHNASHSDDAVLLANCPIQGDAHTARVRELNILKRRLTTPTPADFDSEVSLPEMIASGNDVTRFNADKGAAVVGYVADVKVGGVESVNCHTHSPLYRDTHIELTLEPLHDSESKHVIVEVTPQWREAMAAKGDDWTTKTLRSQLLGRWVKVTGWLFFDEEHANASLNTASSGAHVWRATAWEIHPVTKIEILQGRP